VLNAYKWAFDNPMGTGSWFDVQNWVINGLPGNPLTDQPPGKNDDVTIDGTYAAGTCEISGPATLVQCASLKLINGPPGGVGSGLLIQDGAELDILGSAVDSAMTAGQAIGLNGTGSLHVIGGNFDWYGGTFQGSGTLVVGGSESADASATLLVTQQAQKLSVNLVIGSNSQNDPGTVIIQNLNRDLTLADHTGIQVGKYGTLTFAQTSGNIVCGTGATDVNSVISNGGTINFDTSAAITCDLPRATSGNVNVLQGTLEFTNGAKGSGFSISQTGGSLSISAGATLKADANTNINGGTLNTVGSGTAYLKGNLTVQGGGIQICLNGGGGFGTLFVYGQVSLIGNTLLIVSVDGSGTDDCDQLIATGTITLGGSSELEVSTLVNDTPPASAVFDVLFSSTGFSGDFATKTYLQASYTTAIVPDAVAGFDYELTPAGGGGGGLGAGAGNS
jgi:hypothetical protein